jgi:hypothetical protein
MREEAEGFQNNIFLEYLHEKDRDKMKIFLFEICLTPYAHKQ